jgi:carbonic anhydrase/acetyltransferase-like protein (isoleucine patch superfamily)
VAYIVELNGVSPTIGEEVWLAPTAVLIGDVTIGDRASIWFGAVLRADFNSILVGAGTSIQDNAVLHCAPGLATVVGEEVTIGHGALVEGCIVEDGALVGMNATVLHRARVGAGALVAAGAVVGEGQTVRPRTLTAGVPARERKEVTGSARDWTAKAATDYDGLRRRYLGTAKFIERETKEEAP